MRRGTVEHRLDIPDNITATCAAGRAPDVSDIRLSYFNNQFKESVLNVATTRTTLDDGTPAFIGHQPSSIVDGYTETTLAVPQLNLVAVANGPSSIDLDEELLKVTTVPTGHVVIPNLIGQTVADVSRRLEGLGLTVALDDPQDPPARVVTLLDPDQGVALMRGSTVTLGTH